MVRGRARQTCLAQPALSLRFCFRGSSCSKVRQVVMGVFCENSTEDGNQENQVYGSPGFGAMFA